MDGSDLDGFRRDALLLRQLDSVRTKLDIRDGHIDALKAELAAANERANTYLGEMVRLQEAIAACDQGPWRGMDSAPKDGTPMLLWFPSWYQGKGGHGVAVFTCGALTLMNTMRADGATHWMPLPEAPRKDET